MSKYVAIAGSGRSPLPGSRAVGLASQRSLIEISIKLRLKRKLPDLKSRPTAVMTRAAFGAKYGASKQDIGKVIKTFARYGLKKLRANAATRTIRLQGTVAQLEKAFQTKLFKYEHADGAYRGRVGPVFVPAALKNIVQAVFGLDNRRVARRRRYSARATRRAAAKSIRYYTPAQLAAHNNFPTGDGRGQAIGLLEFGGGFFSSDLRKFCKIAGLPVPKVTIISVDGTSASKRDGQEGEVMLDVEVVAGVCPRASIIVYFAEWTEQGMTALDAVMHDTKNKPGVISVSWGGAERSDIWTDQAISQINETLKEAAYLGISVCVAAGDDGSSDAVMDGLAHVDYPASSPYVLSVGGTTIPREANGGGDIVWEEGAGLRTHGGGSTGGGVSAIMRRPPWQKSIAVESVNPGAIIGRCVPDVAANADWKKSPYGFVVDGHGQINGGTSAASPLWAALIARINAASRRYGPVGYLTPLLYQKSHGSKKTIGALGCTDVTSGDNSTALLGGYSAGPGYDAASGWGTPNGMRLLKLLQQQIRRPVSPRWGQRAIKSGNSSRHE